MSIWKKLFGGGTKGATGAGAAGAEGHALLLHIPIASERPGDDVKQWAESLQEELADVIDEDGTGMVDGSEWRDRQCIILMFGPNADALWRSVARVVAKHKDLPPGSYVIKRYGGPQGSKKDRVEVGKGVVTR